MKKRLALVAAAVALIVPATFTASSAVGSPGGLDRRGGHHCWTNCSRYGLRTGQYHCHRTPCNRRDILRHRRHGH